VQDAMWVAYPSCHKRVTDIWKRLKNTDIQKPNHENMPCLNTNTMGSNIILDTYCQIIEG